jgi:hypothetical protein
MHKSIPISFLLLLITKVGWAETEHLIDAPRIRLGDVVPSVPVSVASDDLGPAPPPGGSRLLSFLELNRILRKHGLSPSLTESVRVVRAMRERNSDQLQAWFGPEIERAMPAGASLVRMETPRTLRVAPSATVVAVRIGKLPRREGLVQTSAFVELSSGDASVQRVSLALTLRLDATASRVAVSMGTPLILTISTGRTDVTALGVAASPGEVGDTVPCRVLRTNRILLARITSGSTAEVVPR